MTKSLTEQIVHIKNKWIDEKCTVPFFDCDTKASFKEGELVGKSNKDEQIERLQEQLNEANELISLLFPLSMNKERASERTTEYMEKWGVK